MKDLGEMTPYELGETGKAEAIPYIIRYLETGRVGEKRLAASAIKKLSSRWKNLCNQAIPALLDCLELPAPQTRQYALNALAKLDVPSEALERIRHIAHHDPKAYNRRAALDVISRMGAQDLNVSDDFDEHTSERSSIPLSPYVLTSHQGERNYRESQTPYISQTISGKPAMKQLQAGYVLEPVHHLLVQAGYDSAKLQGFLRALAYFDVETDVPLHGGIQDIDPILAVVNNIIRRGLPTRPSEYLEESFANTFGLTERTVDAVGSIGYSWKNAFSEPRLLYQALHIVEPRFDPQHLEYLHRHTFDSQFEKDVFVKEIPQYLGEYFPQLLEAQRSLTSILQHPAEFPRQRVDLALEFPYSIKSKRGIVIESDGPQHQQEINQQQHWLDQKRDRAIEDAGWARPVRIRSEGFYNVELQLARMKGFLEDDYFRLTASNYHNPLYLREEGLDALQFVLSPYAIARVQKILVELMIHGILDLNAEEWNLAIIERDVPCAYLAIEDLRQCFAHLFFLENKGRSLPPISLKICTTEAFHHAKLHQHFQDRLLLLSQIAPCEYDELSTYDLLLDVSTLQRSGFTELPIEIECRHVVTIQSAYAPVSQRVFATSDLIPYRPIFRRQEHGKDEMLPDVEHSLRYFLHNIFRKDRFREGQLEILDRALQLQSVIGLLPTGGGKSLTYQFATFLQPGMTLVIDPLKSLMKDQYENLQKQWIDACVFINSSLNTEQKMLATQKLVEGEVLFAFISPERLQIKAFRDALASMIERQHYFSYCVIDEVHCVSEWGHDFRTSYLKLGENAMRFCQTKNLPSIPLFGLTATASFDVLSDVQRELACHRETNRLGEDAIVRFETANRDELRFEIVKVDVLDMPQTCNAFEAKETIGFSKQIKLREILQLLPYTLTRYNQEPQHAACALDQIDPENFFHEGCTNAGIIFCPHRSWVFGVTDQYKRDDWDLKGVYDFLFSSQAVRENDDGFSDIRAGTFLGSGNEDTINQKVEEDSIRHQEAFIHNNLHILVATKAFGMGIDKPNIRFTIHINYPGSLEGFMQEAGRAGRDRKLSLCYILFNDQEIRTEQEIIDVDQDILHYFHHLAFKGPEKERAIIDELLDEITYPRLKRTDVISQQLFEEFQRDVSVNLWKDRLYVNDDARQNYGFLSLPDLELRTGKSHYPQDISRQILQSVKAFIEQHCPNREQSLKPWLEMTIRNESAPGIERRLREIEVGEELSPPIIVQFTNDKEHIADEVSAFFDRLDLYNSAAHNFLATLRTQEYVEMSPWIERMLRKKALQESMPEDHLIRELQRICAKLRNKLDTEKALYRLFTIGVIDDYTVDYNAKTYELHITKKDESTYTHYLSTYLKSYYSDVRTQEEIQKLETYQGATLIRKCLYFLIDFVYAEIAKKRLEAIHTMKLACYEGLKTDGNRAFKEFVDVYFHSKYAHADYLLKDTNYGKIFDFETVWKYMRLISEDKTGSPIDNLKHLRGACLRLLTENPDNACFLLLNAFASFILEPENERLREEAQESLMSGMTIFQRTLHLSEKVYVANLFKFRDEVFKHTNNPTLKQMFETHINGLYLQRHVTWLQQFNKRFLEGYEPTYT